MGITLVTGPANAGKAQVVLDALRAELSRGSGPLLIVPTRADADHYLRELAGGGSALGVRVERFEGLIEEAVRRAGLRTPVIRGIARERAIAAAAQSAGAPGPAPGLVRAAATLISQLRVRRITPARLSAALARLGDGGAVDVAALYSDYDRRLERLGRVDEEQRAVAALDAIRSTPRLWGRTPLMIYGFDDLTALQIDTIETIGRAADITLSLTYERGREAFAGRASTFQTLLPMAAEHRELPPRSDHYTPSCRAALSHLERGLLEAGAERVEAGGAVRLLQGGGERSELELVAHSIRALIDAGMAPGEIAVAARSPEGVADLLHEVLAEHGIPHSLQRRIPLGRSAVGSALIALLRAASPDGTAADLLRWLRAPGMLQVPDLADTLEIEARRAGVLSAHGARSLWEARNWPLETIDELLESQARGPQALIDRAGRELTRLFLAPRRAVGAPLAADEADEARALGAARGALGELRELARLAPELAAADAGELAAELERVLFVAGERPAPGLVAVADPLELRARRVRALFVTGMQEGTFPARARPEPLIGEEQRRRLAESSGLVLAPAENPLAAERYLLYAAVSRPRELLALSWHVADDDGQPATRSLFVDDVCDLLEADLAERTATRALGAATAAAGAAAADPARAPSPITDPRLLEQIAAQLWSASSLQAWIGCPVKWFVEKLLRPDAIDPDAEQLTRGALAHDALREVLEGLRRERGSARLTAEALPLALALMRSALAELEPAHPLSASPERVAPARRRLASDLERYLRYACSQPSPLEPTLLEVGFGFDEPGPGGQPVGPLDLGDGVRVRGRIDRIDLSAGGQAIVYDYKSSDAPAPAKWARDGSIQVALYMEAAEQLLGADVIGGLYQPLSGQDLRPRGLLDSEAGVQLDLVGGDAREPERMRDVLDPTLDAAREAAAQARTGLLRPRPETCGYRGSGCLYPAICRCSP